MQIKQVKISSGKFISKDTDKVITTNGLVNYVLDTLGNMYVTEENEQEFCLAKIEINEGFLTKFTVEGESDFAQIVQILDDWKKQSLDIGQCWSLEVVDILAEDKAEAEKVIRIEAVIKERSSIQIAEYTIGDSTIVDFAVDIKHWRVVCSLVQKGIVSYNSKKYEEARKELLEIIVSHQGDISKVVKEIIYTKDEVIIGFFLQESMQLIDAGDPYIGLFLIYLMQHKDVTNIVRLLDILEAQSRNDTHSLLERVIKLDRIDVIKYYIQVGGLIDFNNNYLAAGKRYSNEEMIALVVRIFDLALQFDSKKILKYVASDPALQHYRVHFTPILTSGYDNFLYEEDKELVAAALSKASLSQSLLKSTSASSAPTPTQSVVVPHHQPLTILFGELRKYFQSKEDKEVAAVLSEVELMNEHCSELPLKNSQGNFVELTSSDAKLQPVVRATCHAAQPLTDKSSGSQENEVLPVYAEKLLKMLNEENIIKFRDNRNVGDRVDDLHYLLSSLLDGGVITEDKFRVIINEFVQLLLSNHRQTLDQYKDQISDLLWNFCLLIFTHTLGSKDEIRQEVWGLIFNLYFAPIVLEANIDRRNQISVKPSELNIANLELVFVFLSAVKTNTFFDVLRDIIGYGEKPGSINLENVDEVIKNVITGISALGVKDSADKVYSRLYAFFWSASPNENEEEYLKFLFYKIENKNILEELGHQYLEMYDQYERQVIRKALFPL